jgi:hypothetical protein
MEEAEVGEILLKERAHDRRLAIFSAILAGESGLGTEGMTVVGGSAIEIYTEGDYVSEDLDLVLDSRSRVTTVLRRWGFLDEGKGWSKGGWRLFVDPMETQNSGSRRLTQIISTTYGSFRISGVEDLIIRRIRESVAWQDRHEAFSQAVLLFKHARPNLDWAYLEFFAKREGWERQLSLLSKKTD